MSHKPVVLCILDGWGESKDTTCNAIFKARAPNWDAWRKKYPCALLDPAGIAAGLPEGQMGNSEVGHMTIGAGRVTLQDLPRIHEAVSQNTLKDLPAVNAFKSAHTDGVCHIMGLFSPGGIHSHMDHMWALCDALSPTPIRLHLWLDGRDTPPKSAIGFLEETHDKLMTRPHVKIATITGRYYAMDRDKRWDRTEAAFNAMALGDGVKFQDPITAIEQGYAHGQTDEFIPPMVSEDYQGMHPEDSLVAFNFRADRMRQILSALLLPKFDGFIRSDDYTPLPCLGMKGYADFLEHHIAVLFPSVPPENTLGSVISDHKIAQLRMAETEKYAHVTFFFNGGVESAFQNEDRILVPSPDVKTYDLKPEMSAPEMTETLCHAIDNKDYGFILVNYANPDMVGHTGNMDATVKALEAVDACLGQLCTTVLDKDGILIITADHGNVEKMFDANTQQPHTAHTCNPVPFLVISHTPIRIKDTGTLADIAPTILDIMHLDQPQKMSGKSLVCA